MSELTGDVSTELTANNVDPQLTSVEARVIAVMVEKSVTTPKNYPMTVNAIMQASNQKSSRSPVMSLTEGEVGSALLSLLEKDLVRRDDSSARATKWEQRLRYKYQTQPESLAVLVASILRGAQTRSELRAHAEPIGGAMDAKTVEIAINKLMERAAPLLVEFPRQPGQKEARLMHRLSGEPELPAVTATSTRAPATPITEQPAYKELQQRIEQLEERLAALEQSLGE